MDLTFETFKGLIWQSFINIVIKNLFLTDCCLKPLFRQILRQQKVASYRLPTHIRGAHMIFPHDPFLFQIRNFYSLVPGGSFWHQCLINTSNFVW